MFDCYFQNRPHIEVYFFYFLINFLTFEAVKYKYAKYKSAISGDNTYMPRTFF